MNQKVYILGGGMTGLAAGVVSKLPVFEAEEFPGGICSSYYIRPGDNRRFHTTPEDGKAYRFEIGGGHWIFGGDTLVLRFIRSITPVKSYERKSAVYFPDNELFVPYPIQNHLRYLGQKVASKVLSEIVEAVNTKHTARTMADWLRANFGQTLYELFFEPFHELYTAGLFREIAPQDAYKTPVNLSLVIQGAFDSVPQVGYNTTFIYPKEGLNTLALRMAERCDIRYKKRVVKIDVQSREIYFEDGSSQKYDELICTLPLNKVIEMTGLNVGERPDPATSVLVVNIGAIKGPKCPSEHWVYIPKSKAGFHRVGFYSNVDSSFLPSSNQNQGERVSIYVEKAYRYGNKPEKSEIEQVCQEIVKELQDWGWIKEVEVVDPTWIDVAYTWSWPGSKWREKALKMLEEYGIHMVGRYAQWVFQGIAESIRNGLVAGGVYAGGR
ncbi:protoporphyrinogen/coproporphyrinogen oxidase [Sulfurihydrogenibium azorense]|uniref:protoporphyrinogen/coproporphyrinogen oxidase n=1 Tax=Sulfurihydrogenibium azorense TaxID=309806 RepID=UPI0024090619|nr:FAD-dependent oxidoreductase [Sulfurihydrogenibium azorense]MDM7274433.1 FAD-dependent oxidoreductase [Sulfurihydrogenibium azorense]